MINNNRGQSLLEALFVVVFTTIIMFAFLQLCIMVVDDMIANEAAFVGMRSAAVTKGSENTKKEEAKKRINAYLFIHYPLASVNSKFSPNKFVFSDKKTVEKYFKNNSSPEEEEESESESSDYITIWTNTNKNYFSTDLSGNKITARTTKVYYFTRIMFGSLVAKFKSERDRLYNGSRRYQSSRSRMVPSPDSAYYNKAYPGAKNFD